MIAIISKTKRKTNLNRFPTGPTEDEIAVNMMNDFFTTNPTDRPGYIFNAGGSGGFLNFLTRVTSALSASTKNFQGLLITPGRPTGGGGLDFAVEAVEYNKNGNIPEDYNFPPNHSFFGKLASDFSLVFNTPTDLHRNVVSIPNETEKIFVELTFLQTFCHTTFDELHVTFGRTQTTGKLTVILSRFLNTVIVDTDPNSTVGTYADDNDLLP